MAVLTQRHYQKVLPNGDIEAAIEVDTDNFEPLFFEKFYYVLDPAGKPRKNSRYPICDEQGTALSLLPSRTRWREVAIDYLTKRKGHYKCQICHHANVPRARVHYIKDMSDLKVRMDAFVLGQPFEDDPVLVNDETRPAYRVTLCAVVCAHCHVRQSEAWLSVCYLTGEALSSPEAIQQAYEAETLM
jgi:hypothetical protein